jgi:toxin HigB-1
VIGSFKHKGLKRLFEEDDRSRLAPDMVEKIRLILSALEEAGSIDDLNQPSFRLHPLKGDLKGYWAVRCAPTGGSSSGLKGIRRRMWTLPTTTNEDE